MHYLQYLFINNQIDYKFINIMIFELNLYYKFNIFKNL